MLANVKVKIQETADNSYKVGLQDGSKVIPSVAAPFNNSRDGMIRHGEKTSFPAEYILKMREADRLESLKNLGAIMKEKPLSEVMTFGTDVANMNGRIVVVTDETILQTDKTVEFVADSLNKIKTLEGSQYDTTKTLPTVTYLFNVVTDEDNPTKKHVEMRQVVSEDEQKVLRTLEL